MKTIVKGAIIALLVVALMGAAEARLVGNTSGSAGNATGTAYGSVILGETNVTFAIVNGTVVNGAAQFEDRCVSGTIEGKAASSAEGVTGTITNHKLDTTGLKAGTYDFKCTTWNKTPNPGAPTTGDVGDVTISVPDFKVSAKTTVGGLGNPEITSASSGDVIMVDFSTNLDDVIAGGCNVDYVLRQAGTTTNKLAGNTTWALRTVDVNNTINLTPTTDWTAGNYEFAVDPNGPTCNGIESVSSALTIGGTGKSVFAITTSGVTWSADKTTAAIDDIVTFTGKGSPFKNLTIKVVSGEAKQIRFVTITGQNFSDNTFYTQNGAAAQLARNTTIADPDGDGSCPTHAGFIENPSINCAFKNGTTTGIFAVTKNDGTFGIQTKFGDDGSYEIEVSGTTDTAISPQKVTVTVKDVSVTVKTDKTTAWLGQEVKITGTTTAGTNVLIAINDKAETLVQILSDKTFEYTWTQSATKNYSEGSVKISVWVCPQTVQDGLGACGNAVANANRVKLRVNEPATDTADGICEGFLEAAKTNAIGVLSTNCDKSLKKSPDASWSISMKDQTVDVTSPISGQQVAEDDNMDVKGAAPGATNSKAFLWIFNSKGTTSGGTCIGESVSVAAPESGFVFDKTFGKSDVTDDPGDYTLVIQSLGRDGVYSDGKQSTPALGADNDPLETTSPTNINLDCNDDGAASTMSNKVGSQILSILQDNALNKAGSDDQKVFKVLQFKVVTPTIKLNACASSVKGADLNVTGTSNRQDGTTIIVKAVGPKELAPVTTTVKNGTFSATFTAATIGADIGTYTVTADDLKGRTDTVTCSIIAGSPCALSVAVKSSKTQVEKDEKAALTATVSNSGDEVCTSTTLTSSVTPTTGATVTWAKTSTDVPAKGSADVSGNFSASADGSYTVTVDAKRGAAAANGTATIGVGKVAAATPAPTGAATPAPTGAATPAATPKPSPGFEAVFAIAGLLAVAYLVNRRKR